MKRTKKKTFLSIFVEAFCESEKLKSNTNTMFHADS